MTFIEAARAVLDQEGRPLRSREIAEKAVASGLLSHVGKTPVQTMSARLSATVAKDNSPFVRIRPGVFGLTEWHGDPPGPKKTAPPPAPAPPPQSIRNTPNPNPAPAPAPPVREKQAEPTERPAESLPKDAEAAPNQGRAGDSASQTKRRKRKKRKTSHVPAVAAPPVPPRNEGKPSLEKEPAPHYQNSQPSPIKTAQASAPSEQTQAPPSPRRPDNSLPPPPVQVGGETELEDMLNHVEAILKRNSRPIPLEKMLDILGIKGESGPALLDALMTTDALAREQDGQRPRFVRHKSGIALVERETSAEIVALENQGAELRGRLIQIAEKQLIRKLRSMPMNSFIRILILYLQRSGFGSMAPVNFHRNGEFHLSVRDRRHQGRFNTGVILRKDTAEFVVRERAVMDLRGALHHYAAMNGMIFTTGQVSEKAIKEGRVPNLPPVVLMDGETLAREMVRLGIGVKVRTLSLPSFDDAFFSNIEP